MIAQEPTQELTSNERYLYVPPPFCAMRSHHTGYCAQEN